MSSLKYTTADLVSLRVAHLGMIQGIIARMSGYSATVKNFAVTLVAGAIAVAFDQNVPSLIWIAAPAIAVFALMDGYYHVLELRYRELYRLAAALPANATPDMDLQAPSATSANIWKAARSLTGPPFYVLLLFSLCFSIKQINYVHAAAVEAKPAPTGIDRQRSSEKVGAEPQRVLGPRKVQANGELTGVRVSNTTAPTERAGGTS